MDHRCCLGKFRRWRASGSTSRKWPSHAGVALRVADDESSYLVDCEALYSQLCKAPSAAEISDTSISQ
jgi:hypothetical protein